MIVQTPKGYVVKSSDGSKTLSKPMTKSEAEQRLHQIEYFKSHKPNGGKK